MAGQQHIAKLHADSLELVAQRSADPFVYAILGDCVNLVNGRFGVMDGEPRLIWFEVFLVRLFIINLWVVVRQRRMHSIELFITPDKKNATVTYQSRTKIETSRGTGRKRKAECNFLKIVI